MPTIQLPITIEPGEHHHLVDRIRQMTDEEYYYFCQDNPDYKFERDAYGNIELMGQTGGETGERNSELIIEIGLWNRRARSGFVYDSSTGFRLPNGATRSPDVAWVAADRRNALTADERKKFPPLCPDFLIELLSESDSLSEGKKKMQEYMDNGCRLGWLIDPKSETTYIYRADGSVSVVKTFDNTLTGEDVLPGFAFELALLR